MDDSWIEEWPFLFPVWSWGTPSAERERSLVDFDEIGRADTGLNIKYSRQNNIPGSAQYCSIFHPEFFINSPSSCVPHAARIICVLQSLWVCWQGNNDRNSKCIIPASLRGAGYNYTHVHYEDLCMTRVLGTILSNYIIPDWFCSGSAVALGSLQRYRFVEMILKG